MTAVTIDAHGTILLRCHPTSVLPVSKQALHLSLWLNSQPVSVLHVGAQLINTVVVVQHPQIALTVGTCERQILQLYVQRIVASLSVLTTIRELPVGTECPLSMEGILPSDGLIVLKQQALMVVLQIGLSLINRHVTELIAMNVEQEIVFVHSAHDVAVGSLHEGTYAVGRHLTASPRLRLECPEFISIVAAQSVPCSKPHEPLLIL